MDRPGYRACSGCGKPVAETGLKLGRCAFCRRALLEFAAEDLYVALRTAFEQTPVSHKVGWALLAHAALAKAEGRPV